MNPLYSNNNKQRKDLTYKYNLNQSRHGWIRLTPAYSVKIVDEIISHYTGKITILDPFSGTGTTTLCASMKGHQGYGIDINPFLVWFGNVKNGIYSKKILDESSELAQLIVEMQKNNELNPINPPPIYNINRWWDNSALSFLCHLKGGIDDQSRNNSSVKNLLLIAFCRTMIQISNAAFNHQSMSFRKNAEKLDDLELVAKNHIDYPKKFLKDVEFTLIGAKNNPIEQGQIIKGDSRYLEDNIERNVDLIVTSPPYPNRMSYIRELRPYMYWLGYLEKARDAGEMDWSSIGGTWGIATSRLNNWHVSNNTYFPEYLYQIMDNIKQSDFKSGSLLANYIGKYFEDIWIHFNSIYKILKNTGKIHYIIGNSKFYDVIVPSENIFKDMLEEIGMNNCTIRQIRKRNSKKELYEFDVTATKD